MLGALLVVTAVEAQSGLKVGEAAQNRHDDWPHWQTRIGLTASGSGIGAGGEWQWSSGQLLGDYYWNGLRPAGLRRSGGFRATSGVLFGQRWAAIGTPALSAQQFTAVTLSRTTRLSTPGERPAESWPPVPYFGVGYSAMSLGGTWGFTADLGFAASQGGLRARRDAVGIQGDDLVRDLRLTPVLQFGATYAF